MKTLTDSEVDEEVKRILKDRVRLRCTNKDCPSSSGFFTASKFRETYINDITCLLCDSKIADELKVVEDET